MEVDLSELKSFPAAAEYLASIYLIHRDYGHVANQRLAQWMHVSNPAVTQAVGRLKKLGLATQERYEYVELTARGMDFAAMVLKRHYLLEHLLVKTLDFPWDKADNEARVLQNHISDELAKHLDEKMGHPQTCPHGNPLPGSPFEHDLLKAPRLNRAVAGSEIAILRISEEGEAVNGILPFCQAHGIKPGSRFQVVAGSPESLRLRPCDPPGAAEFEMRLEFATHIGFQFIRLG